MNKMMSKYGLWVLVSGSLAMGGCATQSGMQEQAKAQPVQAQMQAGDPNLTCREIQDQLKALQDKEDKIDAQRGVKGTEVGSTFLSAVTFLPRLVATNVNAIHDGNKVDDRKAQLDQLFNSKGCKLQDEKTTSDGLKNDASHNKLHRKKISGAAIAAQ